MSDPSYQELANALFQVGVGGNHAACVIGADHPPYTASYEVASEHYGDDMDRYNTWVCWSQIMRASREVFDRLPEPVRNECWKAFDARRALNARKSDPDAERTGSATSPQTKPE